VCETWFPTLRKKHDLRVLDNRMLRRISGSKKKEVIGKWRKFYNEECHNLYSLANIIKVIKARHVRWARHVSCAEKCIQSLFGKLDVKRPLGRCRQRWEDNIKIYSREIGLDGVDWIGGLL
jgi:hypothetical protein